MFHKEDLLEWIEIDKNKLKIQQPMPWQNLSYNLQMINKNNQILDFRETQIKIHKDLLK
jgi:hypothetical protein